MEIYETEYKNIQYSTNYIMDISINSVKEFGMVHLYSLYGTFIFCLHIFIPMYPADFIKTMLHDHFYVSFQFHLMFLRVEHEWLYLQEI